MKQEDIQVNNNLYDHRLNIHQNDARRLTYANGKLK